MPEKEIVRIGDLVERRKIKRESLSNIPFFDPRLMESLSKEQPDKDVILSGSPGSYGLASGPVRIVCNESELSKLQPGDVLVAPLTSPAWTPLFQYAAAVIVDSGGSTSHAAIVAREYGVPAVMGTINGTKILTNGQFVKVDGSRGLVMRAEISRTDG